MISKTDLMSLDQALAIADETKAAGTSLPRGRALVTLADALRAAQPTVAAGRDTTVSDLERRYLALVHMPAFAFAYLCDKQRSEGRGFNILIDEYLAEGGLEAQAVREYAESLRPVGPKPQAPVAKVPPIVRDGIRIHELKCHPAPFQALLSGRKGFEIRSTLDRDFLVGDRLWLREWSSDCDDFTGRDQNRDVCYISAGGQWGLPKDLAVLGLDPIYSAPANQAREATVG